MQPARRARLLRLLGRAGIEVGELDGAWGTGRARPGSACEGETWSEYKTRCPNIEKYIFKQEKNFSYLYNTPSKNA